jgi:hypothetical protein
MSTYTPIRTTQLPILRGNVAQRFYSALSVDFLVQHMVRVSIHAQVAGRDFVLQRTRREIVLPLIDRERLGD